MEYEPMFEALLLISAYIQFACNNSVHAMFWSEKTMAGVQPVFAPVTITPPYIDDTGSQY